MFTNTKFIVETKTKKKNRISRAIVGNDKISMILHIYIYANQVKMHTFLCVFDYTE